MSIIIRPGTEKKPTGAMGPIPSVLKPALGMLYARRAARLQHFAQVKHPMSDYLLFCARLVKAQSTLLVEQPLLPTRQGSISDLLPPLALSADFSQGVEHWQPLLNGLIEILLPEASDSVSAVLHRLRACSPEQLGEKAQWLQQSNFERVDSGDALFIWAVVSLYQAQRARQLVGQAIALPGGYRHSCPMCGGTPAGSVIHPGNAGGLRYLHCSQCECEWHLVRLTCSQCNDTGHLNYWSLDDKQAAIKAESCDSCQSYLKILYQERDMEAEIVADDLASLTLDAAMEDKNLGRSGINPLFFPSC